MAPVIHPGRFLKREMEERKLSAVRLSLDIGAPSGRITDILNFRRAITADTAVRLGRYFGNRAQFWLDLQGQYDIGVVEREKGPRLPGGSGLPMRPEAGCDGDCSYCFRLAAAFSLLIASRIGPNGPYLCCFSLNLSA